MKKPSQKKKTCDHIFYGPKEYGWSRETCVFCGKVKPKKPRRKKKTSDPALDILTKE